MTWKKYFEAHKQQLLTVFILFSFSLVSYGTFNSTIISSDDWSYFVAKYVFGDLEPINFGDRRPLILVLYYLMSKFFGLHFEYYYFVNFLVIFFSAVLVYSITKRVFPIKGWMASLIALSYLVYPVDYSRTWVIMIYIRFWWLVSLGVIWLLLEYAESGSYWKFILAVIGILLPLGAYEGQIGVVLLACGLIAYRIPKIYFERKLAILASISVIGISFFFWRFLFQPRIFGVKDQYVDAFKFNPGIIFDRYLQGLEIFTRGWLVPFGSQIQLSGINLSFWITLYSVMCCIVFVCFFPFKNKAIKFLSPQKISELKKYLVTILIGGAFWLAGYIPVIGLYKPSLGGYASRVNLYAIAGASIDLVLIVVMLGTLLSRSISQKHFFVAAFFIPFIFAGTIEQIQINQERQIAWEAQKTIWNGIFNSVPDIHDDKSILIIIPGYEKLRPLQFKPFLFGWEIQAGSQVLYNNPNIGGYYYYDGVQDATLQFTEKGFKPYITDNIVPYKKLIILYYDPITKVVTLVDNPKSTLSLPFDTTDYFPYENLRTLRKSTTTFRWLVR